ncbi:FAD-dependent thymidylate synthase [Paenibacillus abyssi]|uniref:Flavin-dependent thymidylate synthase n=1 Tax=Paenibacillus abyssi TaxID=1340531 RepID=A0A917CGT2_9BACL|nr:FAD-dependent thymidylate synthase [Paenibacillus abyssi]GGF88276.1 thymidylate synthase (FAD) [Paenibacillus abyssi]
MNVQLIAHTALSDGFAQLLEMYTVDKPSDRAAVALTAIRTCYSPLKPSEIITEESHKYFGSSASDGEGGTDADRLFRHIIRSKHSSTLEHVSYTFAIEGVSRSLLAQLTRHRQFSFSVQSQRYVKFGSKDRSQGFDYVTPPSITPDKIEPDRTYNDSDAAGLYESVMDYAQDVYDRLRACGVLAEDARYVLPNAAACNLVMTANLRALIEFYGKRRPGNGAQWEIADLAERLREEIVNVDAWTAGFFGCSA